MTAPDEAREMRFLQEDLERKRPPRRRPQRIRESVAKLMARRGYGQIQTGARRRELWRKAAGAMAKHSQVSEVRRGTLIVIVRSSLVLQQLTFQQSQLLRRLSELAPEEQITRLQFRIGDIG